MKYNVNIAMMKVARPPDQLCCLGLGSCVGVALYDPVLRIGGLIHILLPSLREMETAGQSRIKFADSGISALVEAMAEAGAAKVRLEAKIAGGAAMFAIKNEPDGAGIGKRNVQSCEDTLKRLGIRLIARDTGGTKGRTIMFDIETGALAVRTIDRGEKVI